MLFVGDKGLLISDYGKHQLLPAADFAGYQRPAQVFPHSPGQHEEWFAAIKGGAPPPRRFPVLLWRRTAAWRKRPTPRSATSPIASARNCSGTPPP
ncbi:MAG: hypothetical protein U1F77_14180 [Kiritimatiellia bacterium]